MTSTTATIELNDECAANWCGHVDSDARPDEHGAITPHDWEFLQGVLTHALGVTARDCCPVCYYARCEAEAEWEAHTERTNR